MGKSRTEMPRLPGRQLLVPAFRVVPDSSWPDRPGTRVISGRGGVKSRCAGNEHREGGCRGWPLGETARWAIPEMVPLCGLSSESRDSELVERSTSGTFSRRILLRGQLFPQFLRCQLEE